MLFNQSKQRLKTLFFEFDKWVDSKISELLKGHRPRCNRIKRARYLGLCQAANELYFCHNPVTGEWTEIKEEAVPLINFLSTWKTYDEIKRAFKKTFEPPKLNSIVDKLIEKKMLITESDSGADNFKEDLIIVGFGDIGNNLGSVSLEAYTVIKNCEKIFCVTDIPHEKVLRNINNNVINLLSYFKNEERGGRNGYLRVAERFVEAASKGRNTIYAARGNPCAGESIPFLISELAKQRNLSVRFISGQSSLDQLFIDAGLDPFQQGLAVVGPQHLEKVIHSGLPMFIVMIGYTKYGAVGHDLEDFDELLREELLDIKNKLLQEFPPNYKVYLLNPGGVVSFLLAEIEKFSKFWQKRVSTLYVPGRDQNNTIS